MKRKGCEWFQERRWKERKRKGKERKGEEGTKKEGKNGNGCKGREGRERAGGKCKGRVYMGESLKSAKNRSLFQGMIFSLLGHVFFRIGLRVLW